MKDEGCAQYMAKNSLLLAEGFLLLCMCMCTTIYDPCFTLILVTFCVFPGTLDFHSTSNFREWHNICSVYHLPENSCTGHQLQTHIDLRCICWGLLKVLYSILSGERRSLD